MERDVVIAIRNLMASCDAVRTALAAYKGPDQEVAELKALNEAACAAASTAYSVLCRDEAARRPTLGKKSR